MRCPEDPRGRLRDRPRLPVRLHTGLVAAVERDVRGGGRPRRDSVPRSPGRVPVVACGAEPHVSRRRVLPGRQGRARAPQGRSLSAPRGGEPRRLCVRQAHPRGDRAVGDAALEAASRAADREREARRRRRVHDSHGAPARHPGRAAPALRDPDRVLRRGRSHEPPRVRRHGHRFQPVPRRRSVGVRPRVVELGRGDREAARARRAPRGGALLGRGSRVLRAATRGQGGRCLLLRLRGQVPP